jgi:nitrite reductase (NADH) small subunit
MIGSASIHGREPATREHSARAFEVDVCALDDVPFGEGRAFRVGDSVIAIFRPRGGGVFALDNRCPHRAGPLADGIVGAGSVICPLHGWRFELPTGHCANENAAVRRYETRVRDGRVRILIGGDE